MKPQPAPNVPGTTDAERFDNAVRRVFSMSKEDFLREEARLKAAARKKRAKTKKPA
jgi:hypothetical protein